MKRLEDMTEPELADLMHRIAKDVEWACFKSGVQKPMFALLLFSDPKVAQYIANCDRSDMIKALRECADRLEHRQTVERVSF